MDKGANVPELELDGGAYVIETYHLGELLNDPEAALDAAQVIVR